MTSHRFPVLLAALVAAACSSSKGATPATTAAPTTTAAGTTSTLPGTTATTAAPATTVAPTTTTLAATTTTVATLRCHTSELAASFGPPSPGAGQIYEPLVLQNIGTRTCQVKGYPGVSLLDASGVQIGAPASREAMAATLVSLAPGASAAALLHTTNGPIGGPCLAPSVKVRVYPPDEFDAIVFPAVFTACGGFSVRPLVVGTTGI